jgi:PAS domain S-box-containing protein
MISPDQTPDQLNAAILNWTHELAPHGIFTTDKDLRITSWNHWLESHSHLRAEQVVGRQLLDIVPTLLERHLDEYFSDALRGEVKVLSRALHGHLLPFPSPISGTGFSHMQQSARIAPLLLEGKVCGTITVVEDVTEREWHNATLRQANESLSLAQRAGSAGIWDWRITENALAYVSPEYRDLYGLSPEVPVTYGQWLQLVHPDDRARIEAYSREFFASGSDFSVEFRILHPARGLRWLSGIGFLQRAPDGTPVRFSGVNVDITARKKAELELADAKSALETLNRDLEQKVQDRTAKLRETIAQLESFSYTVAHDLRAPIRAMEAYSKILLEDLGDHLQEEPKRLLANIGRAARHLDALTKDVLSYTKISTQEIELRPLNVEDVIHDVTAMNPALQPPHSTIAIVRPLHGVLAHSTLLAQCFSNLLDNAVKFVPPDATPRVAIRSEKRAGNVRVWIQDNGIGMDQETQAKIFGIFERARTASEYPGTGIGLAIVAKAVERMAGKYGVESEPGKGSSFWIELSAAD